jgi:hypothetical protein
VETGFIKIKVKIKLSLCLTKYHAMKTYWESGGIVNEDEWSSSLPGRFTPRKRAAGTHWIIIRNQTVT